MRPREPLNAPGSHNYALSASGRATSWMALFVGFLLLGVGSTELRAQNDAPGGTPATGEVPEKKDESAGEAAFMNRSMPPLPPEAPQPSADPRNLEGTWFHREILEKLVARTMYRKPVPMSARAKQILDHRTSSAKDGKPIANASTRCLPPGHPWQLDLNFPFTILQTATETFFVFEEFHGTWKIRMDQPHREGTRREYMGDSVGYWDGGTLVVDTVAFKEPMWVDVTGVPLSKNVHMIHRIRKIDENGPALEIITTIDDPELFASRWSMVRTFAWRPDKTIFAEYNCEQQVGAPDGVAAYGVVQE